ncbi:hypothetical protein MUP59_11550 [Candidatus Bathyarchaeota archaeon]|nr:hypothetical protein [Candidatus Bathyarchaeota archaeon]
MEKRNSARVIFTGMPAGQERQLAMLSTDMKAPSTGNSGIDYGGNSG